MLRSRKVAILGAGRIGEALISGLLSSEWRKPSEIAATARRAERVSELRERHGIEATLSNHDAVAGAALVVIAVKPQDIESLLGEIGGLLNPEQTVLSVAAAIQTSRIENRLSDGVPVVRAMPNAPSTVHEGIAGLCAGAHASDEHLELAETLAGDAAIPPAVSASLAALAARDAPAYEAAIRALVTDFEEREAYLEDVPVADTVLAFQALAAERWIVIALDSAVVPG